MTMSDPVGDMLTRIRNGLHANHLSVNCPHSAFRESICKELQEEGYIRGFSVADIGNNKKELTIELKYDEGQPAIRELKRVSKPGRRIYTKITDIEPFYNGLGVSIISTPRGVMADHRAKTENVGGEIICQVY